MDTLELSATVRKHVDPSAPLPMRMMAAKALVPLPPPDMITALFILTSDADEKVRATALDSAGKLPDRILSSALRDEEVDPPVLGWFLDRLARQDVYAEMLVLNASTPGRRGGPGGLATAARGRRRSSARTSSASSGTRKSSGSCAQPELRPGADRQRLRLLRPLGPDPRRRPADARGAGAHLRPGAPRRRRRTWDPPPTRSSRSTRSWADENAPRWRRGSGSPSPSGS